MINKREELKKTRCRGLREKCCRMKERSVGGLLPLGEWVESANQFSQLEKPGELKQATTALSTL